MLSATAATETTVKAPPSATTEAAASCPETATGGMETTAGSATKATIEAGHPRTAAHSNGRGGVAYSGGRRCGPLTERPRPSLERAPPIGRHRTEGQSGVTPVEAIEIMKVMKAEEVGVREPAPPAPGEVPPKTKTEPCPRIIIVSQPAIRLPIRPVLGRIVPVTVRGKVIVDGRVVR